MSRRRESCFPAPLKNHIHLIWKKNDYVFPASGEAVSRRQETVSRRGEKVTLIHYREKGVGFPGAGGSCVPAPESSGASVGFPGNCVTAPRKLFLGAGERSHSFTIEEECVGFPGAGGKSNISSTSQKNVQVFPAPGKPVPRRREGTGEKSHSFTVEKKMCRFSRRRGKPCPGAGKAVSRRH